MQLVSVSHEYDTLLDHEITPCSLAQIYNFVQMIKDIQRSSEDSRIMLCAGNDYRTITIFALMMAAT